MEIEGKDGSKALLKEGFVRELGRESGFKSNDRTVSRRHVSLQLHSSAQRDDPRVSFEVIGKNPIWIYNSRSGEIRVYWRFERGEMDRGDMFCLSAKNPLWFTLKRIELEERDKTGVNMVPRLENELAETLLSSSGLTGIEESELKESVDFSIIDPVKEFGFVVIGKEFEGYHKKMIRDIKDWDWFLEESGVESEDDDEVEEGKGKKIVGKKRRKGKGKNEDDDWVGESDEDKDIITKSTKVQKPKYSTRSKDRDKTVDTKLNKKPRVEKSTRKEIKEEIEEDDDDDEMLGGFIVDDEDGEQDVESDGDEDEDEEEEEEEEEDFDDDDDEQEED